MKLLGPEKPLEISNSPLCLQKSARFAVLERGNDITRSSFMNSMHLFQPCNLPVLHVIYFSDA